MAIKGDVKWSGTLPHVLSIPVTKDPAICDPESHKRMDLERLIVGPDGGVANTVVYLENISSGKAMDLPEARRVLDQKHCRCEPHILLVPEKADLRMQSSDATLHTIHMEGAATYNLPFPFQEPRGLSQHVDAWLGDYQMQRRTRVDECRDDGCFTSLLCCHRRGREV